MNNAIHTETIERDGYTFRIEHFHDSDSGAPWEQGDGHGPVTGWECRDNYRGGKRPGELILNKSERCNRDGQYRFYDFAEACRIARRDGWGTRNAEPGMSKRQIAALAAREDYEHLRAWCNDEWCYIGVVVTLLDIEGNETDATDSLWGVDDNGDYAATVAKDCVGNIISAITDALSYADNGTTYTSGSRSWIVQSEVGA